jgi:hypothetical protein
MGLTLGLGVTETYRVGWGILLAACFIEATVGVLMLVLVMRLGLPPNKPIRYAVLAFIISIPLPIPLLVFRRFYFRCANGVQYTLVVLGLLWTVGSFLLLFFTAGR